MEAAVADDRHHDGGGFLSRWSRRKAEAQRGVVSPEEVPPPAAVSPPAVAPSKPDMPAPAAQTEAKASPPPPTLADVSELTRDSDFSRFVAPDVDPSVKNAAMKKLFASDPHFNTMDGLDVYIDDFNKFEPIPKAMLRQMVNARMLGLLDDELEEQPKPDNPDVDENADLQLQPHDAAGQPGAGQGLADGADPKHPPPDAVPPRST